MIGGAATFNYLCRLDKYKLNLAGQELKEKKFENYKKICSDLDNKNSCIVNGEKKEPSLSNAVLSFYDLFVKRKNSDKIKVLESRNQRGLPDKLVDIIDGLWGGISQPTTAFYMQDYFELNKELLGYEAVRSELNNKIMNSVPRHIGRWVIKSSASSAATILGPFISNHYISFPVTALGAVILADSIRQYITLLKHEKKNNFVHEKEFRKLLHCARKTDKYITENIDLTPPGRPIALGTGRTELENEAIEIRRKLKNE